MRIGRTCHTLGHAGMSVVMNTSAMTLAPAIQGWNVPVGRGAQMEAPPALRQYVMLPSAATLAYTKG